MRLCGPGGLPQVGGSLLGPDGLLLLSAHVTLSTGLKNCASGRTSVGHLSYIFITLIFRESSSEFIRVPDLSTLHANPAPGAGAGPGEGVRGNSSFYPPIR